MRMQSDCFPCFFKLANRLLTYLDYPERKKLKILKRISKFLSGIKEFKESPAYYSTSMYKIIYKMTGVNDPYKNLKKEYNEKILKLYPELEKIVYSSNDPIYTALKLSAIGNTIDYGVETSVEFLSYIKEIENVEFIKNEYERFKKLLEKSNRILLLADNAGEIIFDKLLLEAISNIKNYEIIIAVRGKPVINDVTINDLKDIKFNKNFKIISNGNEMVGTILDKCNKKFLNYFNSSDIIISKGQANFESLENLKKENLFFLFKSKCDVVSNYLKVPKDSFLFMSTL